MPQSQQPYFFCQLMKIEQTNKYVYNLLQKKQDTLRQEIRS